MSNNNYLHRPEPIYIPPLLDDFILRILRANKIVYIEHPEIDLVIIAGEGDFPSLNDIPEAIPNEDGIINLQEGQAVRVSANALELIGVFINPEIIF